MTYSSTPAVTPDEVLMRRIAAGDPEAFAALFERRQGDVFRFALHMSQSRSIAEDVTQDVFMEVMREAGRFEAARGGVGPWLLGIARNFVRRRFERERLVSLAEGELPAEDPPAAQESPIDTLARAERLRLLRRAILSLPIRYREAVVLCDLQELSYVDAAASLGCAVGTVRSRLHRGRALLAVKMGILEESSGAGVNAKDGRPASARCLA